MNEHCVLLGQGGHARILYALSSSCGLSIQGRVISDESVANADFPGNVLGHDKDLQRVCEEQGIEHFLLGIGSAGHPSVRRRVANFAEACKLRPSSLQHPSSLQLTESFGEGLQLLPRVVVNPGTSLGHHVLINTGAIIEHGCSIGDFCHVASGAVIAGDVQVGNSTHIGAGAVIRQGLSIGDDCVVGAGAVVVKNVPSGAIVVGNPAAPLCKKQT